MSKLASILTASKQLQGDPSITGTDQNPYSAGNLLDSAIAIFGKGADIYNAVKDQGGVISNAPSGQVTAPKNTAAEVSWTKYLPWIGGGAAVLVVLYFVFRSK